MLVLGYGNDLRGDDAAGRLVARAIADLGLSGVSVREAVQLTPELAFEIRGKDRVVFVDADIDVDQTTVIEVKPCVEDRAPFTHASTPAELLRYTSTVGEVPNTAHLVSIPARGFEIGAELSETAKEGVDRAVDLIRAMVDSPTV